VTPQIGRSQLPGKYVFGGYYWGIENTSFFGEPFDGKFGFYWQADQMLSCEPSPYVVEETSGDAKTLKTVAASKPKLNEQGLRWFSFFNFEPAYNNTMPFYFRMGLVYKGAHPRPQSGPDGGGVRFRKLQLQQNSGRLQRRPQRPPNLRERP
jgi:porin